MEKVIFKNKVLEYFDELVFLLFKEEYFNYAENAQLYVDKIVDFVLLEIGSFPHKLTPQKLKSLGSNYIFYKSNKRTTWYIFFEKRNRNYLVTGIINNHCKEAKDFLLNYSLAASFNFSAALSRFFAPFSSNFPVLDCVESMAVSTF